MKIFLSYPSEERSIAERLNVALLQHGHDVFFDRADLPAGQEYDQTIANAIASSELIVFLITPASVTPGRYTLTEIKFTEERWPSPGGHVLPVMVRPTPMATVPSYLAAVNMLVPRGNVVAETAHEVRRLTRGRSLTNRIGERLRSPVGIGALAAILIVAMVALTMKPWARSTSGGVRLPEAVRQNARAVVSTADSGFALALVNPPRLVRFSDRGAQIGEAVGLMGYPVAMVRNHNAIIVATRARDGVMVLDSKTLAVADSMVLDASLVQPPYRFVNPPRRSGDLQSVAVGRRYDLWMTTGDRDGEPTVLRFRGLDRTWEVATFTVDTAGFGPDANGVRLRDVAGEIYGVRMRGDTSALYHLVGFIRIDRFDGKDLKLVRCAHDVAAAPSGNPIFLSCDNELQEVSVDGRQLTVVRTKPTLPVDRTPATSSWDLIEADSGHVIVALNTASKPNDTPVRARLAAVDAAGSVRQLFDRSGAVVESVAMTQLSVVAVLRLANGSTDVVVLPRQR